MIIIETCPECGHDLVNEMIATYPPIPRKACWNCGWSWEGKTEEIIRVPFGGNKLELDVSLDDLTLLNNYNLEDVTINSFEQPACKHCSNNPANGGSGICQCTLGGQQVYC